MKHLLWVLLSFVLLLLLQAFSENVICFYWGKGWIESLGPKPDFTVGYIESIQRPSGRIVPNYRFSYNDRVFQNQDFYLAGSFSFNPGYRNYHLRNQKVFVVAVNPEDPRESVMIPSFDLCGDTLPRDIDDMSVRWDFFDGLYLDKE